MRTILIFMMLLLYHQVTYAQHHDQIWITGGSSVNVFMYGVQYGTMITDFSEDTIAFKYDPKITLDMGPTNGSICDEAGHLMLYSNGMHVHNGLHRTVPGLDTISYSKHWENFNIKDYLPDGSDWKTGLSIDQGLIMLPDPIGKDLYYIFHQLRGERSDADNGLRTQALLCTKVYINTANPEGRVIYKDSTFATGYFQGGFSSIKHANGRDYWLIAREEYNRSFQVYLLDQRGITLVDTFRGTIPSKRWYTYQRGYFSPRGDLFVTSEGVDEDYEKLRLSVFDFDRCDGRFSFRQSKILAREVYVGSVNFSVDGKYLYATDGNKMYQYDTESTDILGSEQTIAVYDGSIYKVNEFDPGVDLRFSNMITGPDGRIYCVPHGGVRTMHVIDYPDEAGTDASVIQNKLKLDTQNWNTLPNFPTYRIGPMDGSSCDTLGIDNLPVALYRYDSDSLDYLRIRFTDLSYYLPDTWMWDFGDGKTYNGRKPYWHTYDREGSYQVCLTVSNRNRSHTYCKTIKIGKTSGVESIRYDQSTIYPNPVRDLVTIMIDQYIPREAYVDIYDIIGRLVVHERLYFGRNSLDVSNLPSGLYTYTIRDDRDVLTKGKLVKVE